MIENSISIIEFIKVCWNFENFNHFIELLNFREVPFLHPTLNATLNAIILFIIFFKLIKANIQFYHFSFRTINWSFVWQQLCVHKYSALVYQKYIILAKNVIFYSFTLEGTLYRRQTHNEY